MFQHRSTGAAAASKLVPAVARRDGGFLFRFFGSAGFSYGVDRGDSPIAGSRTCSSGDAHSDILVAIGRQCVSLKRQQKPAG